MLAIEKQSVRYSRDPISSGQGQQHAPVFVLQVRVDATRLHEDITPIQQPHRRKPVARHQFAVLIAAERGRVQMAERQMRARLPSNT